MTTHPTTPEMMKVWRFDALNCLDDLTPHEEPVPTLQRGEVLVRIRAVSLNYRDIAPVLGRYVWDAKPGLPRMGNRRRADRRCAKRRYRPSTDTAGKPCELMKTRRAGLLPEHPTSRLGPRGVTPAARFFF